MEKLNKTQAAASVLRNTTAGKVDSSYCIEVSWWSDSTSVSAMHEFLFERAKGLRAFWTACHALDDEEKVKPHFHTVFWAKSLKTAEQWATWLTRLKCPAVKSVNEKGTDRFTLSNSVEGSVRYLGHLDNPDKSQGHTIENTILEQLTYDPDNKLNEWWTSPTLNAAQRARKASDLDRESVSLVALVKFCHENDVCSMSEFIMLNAEDKPMLKFCLQNRALVMDIIRDVKNAAPHWQGDSRGALKEYADMLKVQWQMATAEVNRCHKDIKGYLAEIELLKASVKVLSSPINGTPKQPEQLIMDIS